MGNLTFERLVNAPKNIVWEIISDVEAYAEVAPNLSKAVIVSGQGKGMYRRCWDTHGGTWKEQCTLWEEGKRYAMQVDTSDYPYPFTTMQGTWGLEEKTDGIVISMSFDFTPQPGFDGDLESMLQGFEIVCNELLDNWEHRIQEQRAVPENVDMTC